MIQTHFSSSALAPHHPLRWIQRTMSVIIRDTAALPRFIHVNWCNATLTFRGYLITVVTEPLCCYFWSRPNTFLPVSFLHVRQPQFVRKQYWKLDSELLSLPRLAPTTGNSTCLPLHNILSLGAKCSDFRNVEICFWDKLTIKRHHSKY